MEFSSCHYFFFKILQRLFLIWVLLKKLPLGLCLVVLMISDVAGDDELVDCIEPTLVVELWSSHVVLSDLSHVFMDQRFLCSVCSRLF